MKPPIVTHARLDVPQDQRAWPYLAIAQELWTITNIFIGWVPAEHLSRYAFMRRFTAEYNYGTGTAGPGPEGDATPYLVT